MMKALSTYFLKMNAERSLKQIRPGGEGKNEEEVRR
jgi:hypothetical protein